MTKISTDQALERWDELPLVLREALYSESNSDFLWKTCEAEHIPNEKIYDASRISGYVLMGFIHPEDVAEELQGAVGIDKKTASSIEATLNQRIFTPLRPDIDKVYSPVAQSLTGSQIVQPTPPPAPKAPGPQIISESFSASPKLGVAPLASNRPGSVAAIPPAAPTSASPQPKAADTGWSTRGPQNPVVTLGAITPAIPSPTAAAKMPAANSTASSTPTISAGVPKPSIAPGTKTMSEFDRLGIGQKNIQPPTTPMPPVRPAAPAAAPRPTQIPMPPKPTTTSTPAPVMLHEISASSAQSPQFHVNTGMQNQMNGNGNAPRPGGPTRPAILEFGNAPIPTPPRPPQSQSSGYRPSGAPAPATSFPANNAPRQITEITRPAPAVAPKPPTAPTPPAEKVIVKDFLGPEK